MSFNFANAGGGAGGGASSSGTNSGGLFGTAGDQGQRKSSLFGGGAGSGAGTPNAFGGSSTPTTSGGGLFGSGNNAAPGSGSLFGGNKPAASSGASVFGGTPSAPSSGSLFGGGGATPAAPSTGSLFGGGNNTGSAFGAAQNNTNTSTAPGQASKPSLPSLFGNNNQQASGMGSASQFGAGSPAPNSGGLFGSTPQTSSAPSGGLFGATPGASTPKPSDAGQKGTSDMFASLKTAPPSSASMFGNAGNANTASQNTGGTSTPQANKSASSLFPSTTPAGPPPSHSMFGAPKAAENQAPAATTNSGKSGFSFPSAGAGSGSSLFGEVKKDQPAQSPFSLGNAGTQSAAPQQSSTPAPSAQPAGGMFGPPTGSTQSSSMAGGGASATSGGFSLGGQGASSSSAQPAATTATSGSSIFGSRTTSSQPPASAPATAPSMFGANNASSQPAANTSTAAPSLFGTKPATSTSTTAPPLFGAQPASSQPAAAGALASTAAPAAGTTATAGAAASTSGPTPAPQSRLAQKSMDEILTTWSTSLATHQKSFSSLANTVSKWDRMLVENSSAISSLYGRCFQAERDCTEVERQLSLVEHGQSELEALLDRYENDVDKMVENADLAGDGLGGVDAEREKTYKAAESCSARLTDMSHSLTSMIEEINAASSKLSSDSQQQSKQDDPLAQIVRVLNGHLTQLQQIDQGAAGLQQRVDAAQKEARGLEGSRGIGGQGWADEFGRSYLGRG